MPKPSGARLALHSVSYVLQNLRLVSPIAVIWAAVVTVSVAAMCLVLAISEESALGTVMVRMQEGDLMRAYMIVSSVASTFGQLAIAIRWSRLVLLSEPPRFTLSMPRGSARYFARALILLFGWVFLAIPGFIACGCVGAAGPV